MDQVSFPGKFGVMRMRSVAAAAVVFSFAITPALAADLIAPGSVISDLRGQPVGVVVSAEADTVRLKTDRHEVEIPAASVATGSAGTFVINFSQAELNAAVESSLAAQAPAGEVTASVAPQ